MQCTFEGMSRQNCPLDDEPVRVGRQEGPAPHQLVSAGGHFPVDEDVCRWEHDGGEQGHHHHLVVGLPVPQVLVLLTWKKRVMDVVKEITWN